MPALSLKPSPSARSLRCAATTSPEKRGAVTRRISSDSLLEGGRELVIQHLGSEYHLRLTRNDKLILTK